MTKYPCPVCGKRACDSHKRLSLTKLSAKNEKEVDIIIKCHNCKSTLAVKTTKVLYIADASDPPDQSAS